jgi:hypothetical protein
VTSLEVNQSNLTYGDASQLAWLLSDTSGRLTSELLASPTDWRLPPEQL